MKGLLKKVPLMIVISYAAVSITFDVVNFVWPSIDRSGVIESGQYRGLRIGETKGQIIVEVTAPNYLSKLKIVAYKGPDNETILVFSADSKYRLRDSDTWFLSYPSVHKEMLTLSFEDDRLHKIRYERDFLAP